MASYLITGVSRGIGFEFLRQISSDSTNTVVGLVRNKSATEERVSKELPDRKNIRIVQGDLNSYASLKAAIDETAAITGGVLDYVIANAAYLSEYSSLDAMGELGKEPEKLEQDLLALFNANVVGQIHLFNLTVPLVLKGNVKKIIALGSGFGDPSLSYKYNLWQSGPYSISKAALNMVIAKYSAEYADRGILFMAVSPGMVDNGTNTNPPPEKQSNLYDMVGKFQAYEPDFKGPSTPELAVGLMLSVVAKSSVAAGNGGTSVSQYGNDKWL